MIIDISTQLSEAINNAIENKISILPKSFPCKITKVYDDGIYVEVETLLKKDKNDKPLKIPVMQSSYLKIPYQEGDIGLALNCSFLFDVILDDRDIEKNIEALKGNALFFVPLVPKKDQKQTIEDLVLLNKNKDIKVSLKDNEIELNAKDKSIVKIDDKEVLITSGGKSTSFDNNGMITDLPIEQNGLIDITGVGGNLYQALDILIQMMDLLAGGMQGELTNATQYLNMRDSLISALKAIIKE